MNLFAHAGHDHAAEIADASNNAGPVIGVILLAVAILIIGYLAYDSVKKKKK